MLSHLHLMIGGEWGPSLVPTQPNNPDSKSRGRAPPLRPFPRHQTHQGGLCRKSANIDLAMAATRETLFHRLRSRLLRSAFNAPRFLAGVVEYRRGWKGGQFPLRLSNCYPILSDLDGEAGAIRGHYFHQDLWAARSIYAARPSSHVDVGSRIDGFVGHLLAFMPVTVVDIRPLRTAVGGLTFIQDDATVLSRFADRSVESLSSLHAVEHFGLGRYGDRVDPEGCFKGMRALARILKVGGRLYFSVPIGRERLEFNAGRIFSPDTILEAFHGLQLASFAGIDDMGRFRADVAPKDFRTATNACGLFEFTLTQPH